jgi:hypothetical protein
MRSLNALAILATATLLFGCGENAPAPTEAPPAAAPAEAPPPEPPPAEAPPPEPPPAEAPK